MTLLATAVVGSLVAPSAQAGKPTPTAPATPPPTAIQVDVVDTLDLPDASGSPDVLVEEGVSFKVVATLVDDAGAPRVYSTRTDTAMTLSLGGGPADWLTIDAPRAVLADQTSATFTVTIASGDPDEPLTANGLTLTVSATSSKAARDLQPGTSGEFDVVSDAETVIIADRGKSLFVSAGGVGVENGCVATPLVPTCTDLVLPHGVDSDVFFSTGSCADVCRGAEREVLQVLADLDVLRDVDGDGDLEKVDLYSPTSPATVIFRCDKTLCGGGGVPSKELWVNLSPTGSLAKAPACGAKNVMDAEEEGFCVDYAQSRRDGSGDTYLYLLLVKDVRMSF